MAGRGVNKVILVGNLGGDPDVRYAANGNAITKINVATTSSWRDKETKEMQERTEWHRVVFFGRLAEIVGEYLRKGSQVYIEGSLRTNKWTDEQTGTDRYTTEIIANEMVMLGSRQQGGYSSSGGSSDHRNNNNNHMRRDPPAARQQQNHNNQNTRAQQPDDNSFDDDIPF